MCRLLWLLVPAIILLAGLPGSGAEAARAPSIPRWTFMVYLDADNNLQPYADFNISQMEKVGSSKDVNVVVLYDRSGDGADGLYKVEPGKLVPVTNSPFAGELNMGSGDTVKTFLSYVVSNYPAQHYVLDIWDHGNDFVGTCIDNNSGISAEPTYLYHSELVDALQSVESQQNSKSNSNARVDVLAFDGCLQGIAEVAYDFKDLANYLVASEGYVLLDGFPYDSILSNLANHPDLTPAGLSQAMVNGYVDFYAGQTGADFATLSSVDLSQVDTLVTDLNSMLITLQKNIGAYESVITSGRGQAHLPWSEYGWDAIVDLYTLAEATGIGSRVLTDIDSAVYVASSHRMTNKSVHGLGIFFPPSQAAMISDTGLDGLYYYQVPFAVETQWLSFLEAYYAAQ